MTELQLTKIQAARIGALINGTDKSQIGPQVLESVKVNTIGGQLIATATDRYTITEYRTPTEAPDGLGFYLNADALKFATAASKSGSLMILADSGTIRLTATNGATFQFTEDSAQFPDVAPFLEAARNRATDGQNVAYRLSAKRLELLTKLAKAFSKEAAYDVNAAPYADTNKPAPILYTMEAAELNDDTLAVLIQPMNRAI